MNGGGDDAELRRRAREEGPAVAILVAFYVGLLVYAAADCRGTSSRTPQAEESGR